MAGHPKFHFGLTFFLILLGVCWPASSASAGGNLRIIVSTNESRSQITLNEEKGFVSGEINDGSAAVTPVHITYGTHLLTLKVGKHSYPVDRIESDRFVSYGGMIENDRGISAQAEKNEYGLVISGTVENETGRLIDFTAVSDVLSGTLKITWSNHLLLLSREADKPDGNCQGNLIHQEMQRRGSIECQSSGSLRDALFKNPDQILAWLVIPFVK